MTIDRLGDFLQHNLVVLLAFILIPLKIVVIRLCRDRKGEASAILSIPEDVSYVALGLILSDLLIPNGAFHHYFLGSRHVSTDISIVIGFNVGIALAVHMMSQPAQSAYELWRSTDALAASNDPMQGELDFAASENDAKEAVLHLIAHHFVTLAMWYGSQLLFVVLWLHWLTKVIASVQN